MSETISVVKGNGEIGALVDWSVSNGATPTIIGRGGDGIGNLDLTAVTVDGSEFLDGNTLIINGDYGFLNFTVDSLSPGQGADGDGITHLTGFGLLGQLNVEKVAPPIYASQTLSDAFSTYIGLCFNTPPTINFIAISNPIVAYIGWRGNVLEMLNNLCATTRTGIGVANGVIEIRDIGTNILDITNIADGGIEPTIDSDDIALTVEVEAQNAVSIDTAGDFIYNLSNNPSVETNATGWLGNTVFGTATTAPVRSTALSYTGAASFRGVSNALSLGSGGYKLQMNYSMLSTLPADNSLTNHSFYYRISTPSAAYLFSETREISILWYNAANVLLDFVTTSRTTRTVTATWLRESLDTGRVAPIGATYAYTSFVIKQQYVGAPSTPSVTLAVDAHQVSASLIPYFDGNSAGASWTGTTNNSNSVQANTTNTVFYDAAASNGNIYTVDVLEEISETVDASGTPSVLVSPVQVTSNPSVGQFMIIDSAGVVVTASAWGASGGSIQVMLNPEPGKIDIHIKGPSGTIVGTVGPYSFAQMLNGVKTAALSIFGAGVKTSPQVITLHTGADPSRTQNESGTSITGNTAIPFITSNAVARDRGADLARYHSGPRPSIDFGLPKTSAPGYGVMEGSLVLWRDGVYRVTSVNFKADIVSCTAELRTLGSDFDTIWAGKTGAQFDAFWGDKPYTANDMTVRPLWNNN